jgi:hypothetical protein
MSSLSYSTALRLTNTLMMVSSILSVFGVVSLKLGLVDYKSPNPITIAKKESEIKNNVPLFSSFMSFPLSTKQRSYDWNMLNNIQSKTEVKEIFRNNPLKTTTSSSEIIVNSNIQPATPPKEFSISSVTSYEYQQTDLAVLSSKNHGWNMAGFSGN